MKNNLTEEHLKKLARTSFFIIFIIGSSKILSYFYRVVVAREFGSEVFGLFSLATTIITITAGIFSLGFGDSIVRYASVMLAKKEYSKLKSILIHALLTATISSIFILSVYFFFSNYLAINIYKKQDLAVYLKILALYLPVFFFSNIFLGYLRAQEKIKMYSFLGGSFQNLLKLALLFILLYLGFKERALMYSYFLPLFIVLALAFLLTRKDMNMIFKSKSLKKKERRKILFEFLNYSWPLAFVSLILNVYYLIDSLIVGYFYDSSYVGYYSAAITVTYLFAMSQDLFMQLFFPLMSKEYANKKYSTIKETSKQITKWMYLLNIPLFFLMFYFPGVFLNIFFGSEFTVASNLLRVLSVGGIIAGFNGIFINLLSVKGNTRLILFDFFVFSVLNLVLDIYFLTKFGLIGVAIATVISYLLLSITLIYQVKKYFGFLPLKKDLIKITLVSLPPFIIMIFISNIIATSFLSLAGAFLVFSLVYLALLYLTKCFDNYDLLIIKAIFSKIIRMGKST